MNKAKTNVSFLKPRNQQTRKIPPNRVWLSGKGLGEDDKEDKRYKEVKHGHAGVCFHPLFAAYSIVYVCECVIFITKECQG